MMLSRRLPALAPFSNVITDPLERWTKENAIFSPAFKGVCTRSLVDLHACLYTDSKHKGHLAQALPEVSK